MLFSSPRLLDAPLETLIHMFLFAIASDPNPYWEVLGRFHPLLLHFPIAFILAAACIELVRWLAGRRDTMSASAGFCLWAGLVMGGLSVWAGWLLADHNDMTGDDVFWHRWTAIAAMGLLSLAAVAWVLRRIKGRDWVAPHLGLLLLSAVMICVSGHLGAEMVWGEDWVFEPLETKSAPEVAPSPAAKEKQTPNTQPSEAANASTPSVSTDTPVASKASNAPLPVATPTDAAVLWADVQPIFEQHCGKCHGKTRQKADLQLVPWAAIFEFEPEAWAITPGDAAASWVHQRITLPAGNEDVMPPEDKGDPLSAVQIARIDAWINQGAIGPDGQAPVAPKENTP